jgi:hypothetical protein
MEEIMKKRLMMVLLLLAAVLARPYGTSSRGESGRNGSVD